MPGVEPSDRYWPQPAARQPVRGEWDVPTTIVPSTPLVAAGRAGPPPSAPVLGWAPPAPGWAPMAPSPMPPPRVIAVEPDAFWGARAAPRLARWSEAGFWASRPRMPVSRFEDESTRTVPRFAAWMLLAGFFGILSQQFGATELGVAIGQGIITPGGVDLLILRLLAIMAPLFEEWFKLGLALVLVAWLPRSLGPFTLIVRMAAAWTVGAAFGWMEHTTVYDTETTTEYAGRVLFHGIAAGLGMGTYCVLEALGRPALRWFSTCLSSPLHWLVNAMAVPLGVASQATDQPLDLWWAAGVLALGALATLMLPGLAGPLRSAVAKRAP